MTPDQTIAVIKFMSAHGADRVKLKALNPRFNKYTAGRFTLGVWADGTCIHWKGELKHLDNGPAVFGWKASENGWWKNGKQIPAPA